MKTLSEGGFTASSFYHNIHVALDEAREMLINKDIKKVITRWSIYSKWQATTNTELPASSISLNKCFHQYLKTSTRVIYKECGKISQTKISCLWQVTTPPSEILRLGELLQVKNVNT